MYLDKLSGVISKEVFLRLSERFLAERMHMQKQVEILQNEITLQPTQGDIQAQNLIDQFLNAPYLQRELVLHLLKKVELTQQKELILHFRCKNPAG